MTLPFPPDARARERGGRVLLGRSSRLPWGELLSLCSCRAGCPSRARPWGSVCHVLLQGGLVELQERACMSTHMQLGHLLMQQFVVGGGAAAQMWGAGKGPRRCPWAGRTEGAWCHRHLLESPPPRGLPRPGSGGTCADGPPPGAPGQSQWGGSLAPENTGEPVGLQEAGKAWPPGSALWGSQLPPV